MRISTLLSYASGFKEAVKEVLSRSIRVRDVSVDVDVPEHPR